MPDSPLQRSTSKNSPSDYIRPGDRLAIPRDHHHQQQPLTLPADCIWLQEISEPICLWKSSINVVGNPWKNLLAIYTSVYHLTAPMKDDEFTEFVLTQLPFQYQEKWPGRTSKDLADFRYQLLRLDQLERQVSIHHHCKERPLNEHNATLYPGPDHGNTV
ncbi:hypothetical protein PR048_015080 [Dryococelus australis]|uniref:Uncharacterized protein n=1 Tax=Dryococelus australis TaxID=614101 RepID=A0ABQ9HG84_9NEOP|nr:hypothetical protein PR048_015080 [Dryococelus australis]